MTEISGVYLHSLIWAVLFVSVWLINLTRRRDVESFHFPILLYAVIQLLFFELNQLNLTSSPLQQVIFTMEAIAAACLLFITLITVYISRRKLRFLWPVRLLVLMVSIQMLFIFWCLLYITGCFEQNLVFCKSGLVRLSWLTEVNFIANLVVLIGFLLPLGIRWEKEKMIKYNLQTLITAWQMLFANFNPFSTQKDLRRRYLVISDMVTTIDNVDRKRQARMLLKAAIELIYLSDERKQPAYEEAAVYLLNSVKYLALYQGADLPDKEIEYLSQQLF